MKKYKLIWMGVGLSFLVFAFNFFLLGHKALALTTADIKSPPATYKFLALNTVQATINGKPYKFVDGKTSDNHYSYSTTNSDFCQPGSVSDDNYGIKFDSDPAKANSTINGTITLGVPSGPNCNEIGPVTIKVSTGGVSSAEYEYSGNNIISLQGNNTYEPYTSGLPSNYQGRVYALGTAPGSCGGADQNDGEGEIIIMGTAGGSTGKMYILTNKNNGFSAGDDAVKEFPELKGIIAPGTCWDYMSLDVNKGGPQPAIPITVTGQLGGGPIVPPGGGTGGGGGDAATPADTCELSSNGFSLAWLMCPVLLAGEEISNNLINAFENELSFNVSQGLGGKDSQAGVEKTWSLFKNIATAILVILMLVMVFSQAVSIGPFDAYTVRKMLPRLVIVAIAIQLSWPLVAFIIDRFDDIGRGIANIMYFSFGGADALSLGHLLSNASIDNTTAGVINWSVLVGAIGLGIAALPAVLLLLLAALAAITAAVITLILRKIIIILLLMTAPIALLAYVLPGTQRYWKLWIDNLIKILAMFPLVVALVAAGRIFAYIVGTQDNSKFLNLIFVCIGFFGPLFFLPKTFKWGGQLMAQASNGVSSATNRFVGKESALGKGVEGWAQRKQGEKGKAYNPLDPRWKRGLRRVQSGHFIPFSERSRRLAIAEGNKWASERTDEAEALVSRAYEKALTGGYKRLKINENGNYLNEAGEITDKQHAYVEDLKGVEAGKQALVDITGWEGSDAANRAAQTAHKKLLDTKSEIELQKARIQGGRNEGKRFTEVESFRDTLENSPPHYGATSGSRPDQTPDVQESAFKQVGYDYDEAYAADNTDATRDAEGFTEMQRRVREIDKARIRIALQRLTPENVSSAHYGFYQDIARLGDRDISAQLASKLSLFKERGGVVGANSVGSLRGGKEPHVNAALALAGASLDHLPSAPEPVRPPEPDGGIDIPHDDTPPPAGA